MRIGLNGSAILGMDKKRRLSLLGSTGSIGTQTLDICRERPNQFECVAMAAGNNIDLLAKQVSTYVWLYACTYVHTNVCMYIFTAEMWRDSLVY